MADPGFPYDDAARRWVQVGDERVEHRGWFRAATRTYRLPDGTVAEWHMFGGGQTVAVLPLTHDGRVVCITQYRPGPDRVLLNLPGGIVDPGEGPVEAGLRELTEETGYVSDEAEHVVTGMAASSTGQRHVVIARNCEPTGVQDLDPLEDCEPVVVTVDELRAELRSGRMTGNEQVYFALDHAGLL